MPNMLTINGPLVAAGVPKTLELALIIAVAAIGTAWLAWPRAFQQGSTLRPPVVWGVVAWLAVCGWMAISHASELSTVAISNLRYVAACLTLTPVMAVLGSKRPQDRAWQFIVLSLAVILLLPYAATLIRPRLVELHTAWRWFLLLLWLLGVFNYLPTRWRVASALLTVAQLLLFGEFMPYWIADRATPAGWQQLATDAWGLASLGLIVAMLNPFRAPSERHGMDRVWLDFRNAWGTVWSLRVMERFNSTARQLGWPLTLTWQGLVAEPGHEPLIDEVLRELVRTRDDADERSTATSEMVPAMARSIRSLLRRFVSPEWIAARTASG